MIVVSQVDNHASGQLIGASRNDLAYASADARDRFDILGAGSFHVAPVSRDVITASVERRAAEPLKIRFQSDGWCGFSYCLSGWCAIDSASRTAQYCPDAQVFYNGGSQTFAVPKGVAMLTVGVSGTPAALADFLGLAPEDLTQILDRGAARVCQVVTQWPNIDRLRRSAACLAESLCHDQTGHLGLLRARAAAMAFGLYMLESMDGSRAGTAHALSIRRRVESAAALFEDTPRDAEPIGAIATRLGFSRSALDQAFRTRFGCSPGAFRIESRLRKVARALLSTDAPITSLAMEFGFSSSSNLTRLFRSRYGLPPTLYRNRSRR